LPLLPWRIRTECTKRAAPCSSRVAPFRSTLATDPDNRRYQGEQAEWTLPVRPLISIGCRSLPRTPSPGFQSGLLSAHGTVSDLRTAPELLRRSDKRGCNRGRADSATRTRLLPGPCSHERSLV